MCSSDLIAEAWLDRQRVRRKKEQERIAELACALAAAAAKAVASAAVQHQRSVSVEVEAAVPAPCARVREPSRTRSPAPTGKKSFTDAVRELRPYFSRMNLGVDDYLITRGQVYRVSKAINEFKVNVTGRRVYEGFFFLLCFRVRSTSSHSSRYCPSPTLCRVASDLRAWWSSFYED